MIFSAIQIQAQENGKIISHAKVVLPPFSQASPVRRYYDSVTYTAAVNDKSVTIEKLIYMSDGLKIVAYLSTPAVPSKEKYPVIVFNRGSTIRNDMGVVYTPMFKKFVREGFIVIAPALRESEGGEGKDELGGNDLHDILNVVPLLKTIPLADVSKLFMLGESRGGIMTYMAIREKFPMKAAATIGAITDMEMFIKDTPAVAGVLEKIYPDYAERKEEILRSRSALSWSEAINVPALILNGQADPQVKVYHAMSLAQKLADQKKPYQLIILEGGNHNLTFGHANERDKLIVDWFKKYL